MIIIQKVYGSLWQYYKDEPNDNLADSKSFKSKIKITENTPADGNTKDVEIIVPLKYLSNFWRTLEMPLINCKVNLILTWSSTCAITNSTGVGRFAITETKLYVLLYQLKIMQNYYKLKSSFIRTIKWNKYQSDPKSYTQNQCLNHLIDPSFHGINRCFENENEK